MPIYADDPLQTLASEPRYNPPPDDDPVAEARRRALRRRAAAELGIELPADEGDEFAAGAGDEAAAADVAPAAASPNWMRAVRMAGGDPDRVLTEPQRQRVVEARGMGRTAVGPAADANNGARQSFGERLRTAILDRERGRLGLPSRDEAATTRAKRAEDAAKSVSDLETAARRRRQIEALLGESMRKRTQSRLDAQRAADEANLATEQGAHSEADPAYQQPIEAGGPPSDEDVAARLASGGASQPAARALTEFSNMAPEARAGRTPVARLAAREDESGAFLPERRVPLTTQEFMAEAERKAKLEKFRATLAGKTVAPGSTVLGPEGKPFYTAPERATGMGAGMPGASGITPLDPSTIPAQYRNQVVAIAEGRQKVPSLGNRPGSPGYQLMQLVNDYDPSADFSTVNARWAARQEMTKGSAQSRGGQITRLNQLSGHLGELEDASNLLTESGLSNSDSELVNRADMAATLSANRGPIASFNAAANTVVQEYIAAVTGGRPTEAEEKTFKEIQNPAAAPAYRKAAINRLRSLAQDRANAQEDWHVQTFGRPSASAGKPLFGRGWEYTDGGWRMTTGHAASPGDGAAGGSTQLPRPRTPAEAQALPAGTVFLTPDGKRKVRP
jgi:hypothetical protein